MNNSGYMLKDIFELNLYYFSEKGVELFFDYCSKSADNKAMINKYSRLICMDENDLKKIMNGYCEKEDRFAYMNIYLWKQKYNVIPAASRVCYYSNIDHFNWIIHRNMTANGYESILSADIVLSSRMTTYREEIETYKGFFTKTGYDDDDYFTYLGSLFNVAGPRINQYDFCTDAVVFMKYMCNNYQIDYRIKEMFLPTFALLIYDLNYDLGESWPLFSLLLQKEEEIDAYSYPGGIIGIRLFGDKARELLSKMNIFGGYELLNILASN